MGSFSKICGGNVPPSRFVKLQSDGTVVLCGAGEDMWGISQAATRNSSLTGLDDGYAGISGEAINIFGPGDDQAQLELGGTVTVGQRIKSDASGKGVSATTDKDRTGAICSYVPGVSGELITVKPDRFDLSI